MSCVTCGLNFRCGLDGAGVCITASKTGHECWLGGACLDHSVVASGMHIDCFSGLVLDMWCFVVLWEVWLMMCLRM